MWNRNAPNRTALARSRSARYVGDAFDSGWRPSQSRPSSAPPRESASAWGERRPGGGRRRRGVESPPPATSGRRGVGPVGRPGMCPGGRVGCVEVGLEGLVVELVVEAVEVVVEVGIVVTGHRPRPARPMPVPDEGDTENDEPEGHELGGRNPEERPVAGPERLQDEP